MHTPKPKTALQLIASAGLTAAVDSYYAHKLEVDKKADMGGCRVIIQHLACGLLLSAFPQTGSATQPSTHTNHGQSTWLRERCNQGHRLAV